MLSLSPSLRLSVKDVRTKLRNIDPLSLVHKMSALAQPPPACPCGHIINFEKIEGFYAKKYGRPHLKNPPPLLSAKCPHWSNSLPLTADVFYGRHLSIQRYSIDIIQ